MANDIVIECKDLQKYINKAAKKIEKAPIEIIDELSDIALKEMERNYANAEYQAGEKMDFKKSGSRTEKNVSMIGAQAWYSEFGTGTRGQTSPHPLKGKFTLNPYNSGKTIRPASAKVSQKTGIPPGALYWTYMDENGEIHYTQGIPAQKEVYNAAQVVKKKVKSVIKKEIEGMFK